MKPFADPIRSSEIFMDARGLPVENMAARTELQREVASYRNSAEYNDVLWKAFAERTDGVDFLKAHRNWVEEHSWGYGDRAFHYMWYLLLKDDVLTRHSPSVLEIGVYKGQVISLWALIAQHLGRPVTITAISPLEGSKPWPALTLIIFLGKLKRTMIAWLSYFRLGPVASLLRRSAQRTKGFVDRNLITDHAVRGINHYERLNYRDCITRIFMHFGLENTQIQLVKGQSQDEHVRGQVGGRSFDIVYIDGDHRFEAVIGDLDFYAPLVRSGGYLVMDDASCNVPGTVFPKGHESVSRAVEHWGAPGFANVINVGHNRVYRRT